MRQVAIAIGFVCGLGGSALADDKAAKPGAAPAMMEAPKPAKEMEQLKAMVRSQSCSGKMFASPLGPEGPMKGKITIKEDFGGHFYSMRWESPKTKTAPAMTAGCFLGYDGGKKLFTEACVDSMGGVAHGSSKGWDGDKWTWDEEMIMGGQKMKGHTVITKGKGKEVTVTSDIVGPDGKAMPIWETLCK